MNRKQTEMVVNAVGRTLGLNMDRATFDAAVTAALVQVEKSTEKSLDIALSMTLREWRAFFGGDLDVAFECHLKGPEKYEPESGFALQEEIFAHLDAMAEDQKHATNCDVAIAVYKMVQETGQL